jgi:hypothetical protein
MLVHALELGQYFFLPSFCIAAMGAFLCLTAQSSAACRFIIEKPGSCDEAMVARGGVALNEISGKAMESRRADGLFFAR